MKGHIGSNGLIGDVSQDKKQNNVATEDEHIAIIDEDI